MVAKMRNGLGGIAIVLAAVGALAIATVASATTYSDRGAAVLIWPKIVVDDGDFNNDGILRDTLVRIVNDDDANQLSLHCFYVNANSHCTNTGQVCLSSQDCDDGTGFLGSCQPGWTESDFDVTLSPRQPLAWRASAGMSDFPLPKVGAGPTCMTSGQVLTVLPCLSDLFCQQALGDAGATCFGAENSNAGSRVPPVPESPFIGELKCIQVDPRTGLPAVCDSGTCASNNDATGTASIESVALPFELPTENDVETYNAVGIRTQPTGNNDGDGQLVLGPDAGTTGEYQTCPAVVIFNHFFDDAVDPVTGGAITSELTLVPCAEDFVGTNDTQVTAQFLIFNEFEQRFSTSRQVPCLLDSEISLIDTTQRDRSIFNVAVSGTLAGQTRIRGVGGGLVGAATMAISQGNEVLPNGAAYNLNQFGDRSQDESLQIPE